MVLRLPPYQCVFNPIELLWAWIKGEFGKCDKTFKIADVRELVKVVMAEVPPEQWADAVEHCSRLIDEAWVTDGLQEEVCEQIVITLGGDSNSSSDSE